MAKNKKGKIDLRADREFKKKHEESIKSKYGGGWGPQHEKALKRLRQSESNKNSLKIKDD